MLQTGMEFETPYGTTVPMKLYELDASVTADGKPRRVLFCPFHGWANESPFYDTPSERAFWVFQQAGVKYILTDGSGGGINPLLEPGDMIAPMDLIDLTKRISYLEKFNKDIVRMRNIVSKDLHDILVKEAKKDFPRVFGTGIMAVTEGPRFETPAEVRMLYDMLTRDPIVVDEYSDLARMTGIKGLYRSLSSHALNQKAVARRYASETGRRYEDMDLIVAHIDGGITIAAHRHGRMTDCNSGAGGDGPYTPSRIGSTGVADLVRSGLLDDPEKLWHMCNTGGGLTDLLGTNDADQVLRRIEEGDAEAERAWNGMLYQICKQIGAMAAVLEGKAEAILLTGGLVRYDSVVSQIRRRCGWIAPIHVYPGEAEMEALADGALGALRGDVEALDYTGIPVFSGFDD